MELNAYFEQNRGIGVLATADADGHVDAAIYARPHMMEDGLLALIMRDRLSRQNLLSNPHAAYLFIEQGPGYQGKRLFLTRVREEHDSPLLETLCRRKADRDAEPAPTRRFLVFFRIDRVMPLIGVGEPLGEEQTTAMD